jgi:tryptophan-rich sensory protein
MKNWRVLIVSLVVVYLVALFGSLLTGNVKSEWYREIKPAITPQNFVFPIVWNILFFLIALSLFFSYIKARKRIEKGNIIAVFAANFLINIAWSLLFFYLKNPKAAFIDIVVLWFSILLMIFVTKKTSKLASWLLLPYLLWVSFAAILNFLIIS